MFNEEQNQDAKNFAFERKTRINGIVSGLKELNSNLKSTIGQITRYNNDSKVMDTFLDGIQQPLSFNANLDLEPEVIMATELIAQLVQLFAETELEAKSPNEECLAEDEALETKSDAIDNTMMLYDKDTEISSAESEATNDHWPRNIQQRQILPTPWREDEEESTQPTPYGKTETNSEDDENSYNPDETINEQEEQSISEPPITIENETEVNQEIKEPNFGEMARLLCSKCDDELGDSDVVNCDYCFVSQIKIGL